ncbi:MAG: methylated-DNA--[protein]-cysteine S-methyltransferase [Chloroflexi bacterium]|nr:methylated-DNA--[protein]-cysteine S-methyltransferase [Chloroflexota bacterium]
MSCTLSFFDKVYLLVQQIPRGKVAYYGQIAEMLGEPRAARTVGWALASLSSEKAHIVPWHRVINKAGRCSIRHLEHSAAEQQALLEAEGVKFDERGYVDWSIYGWSGLAPHEVRALFQHLQPISSHRSLESL